MDVYKYQALDLDRPSVRFLRLFSGYLTNELRCELFQGWIGQSDSGLSYAALSYTWGSMEKSSMITVNGRTMYITSNLFAALQHLRLTNEDRILWIDAICIDQANTNERRHQVQHMGDIYREADHVLVWLGCGNAKTNFTMDFMKRLPVPGSSTKTNDNWRRSVQTVADVGIDPGWLCEGMEWMLEQPWFRRIWILQEIASSRVVTILCGRKSVSARIFALVPSLIGITPRPHCQAVLDIMPGLAREVSWWAQKRDLYTLLGKFKNSEATDGRDIIYGLLGLSSDAYKSIALYPDYKKSTQEVIRDTVSFLLNLENQDSFLAEFSKQTLPEFLYSLEHLSSMALGLAAEKGHEEVVILLLQRNEIPVNARGTHSRTPLERAANNGHKAVLRILFEQGATFDGAIAYNQSLLRRAVAKGDEGIFNILFENIQDAGDFKREFFSDLILEAAENGDQNTIQVLIKNGANLDSRDISKRTPLLLAVMNRHKAVVQLLIAQSANLELMDDSTWTPLLQAVDLGHTDSVQILLKGGTKIDCQDCFSKTPLLAATKRKHKPIVQQLVTKGADIELKDKDNWTPLLWAIDQGYTDIVQILLEGGAKIDYQDCFGNTPLLAAMKRGHKPIIQLLVAKGTNIESKDKDNWTPLLQALLLAATKRGHKPVVQLLVAKGTNIESKDKDNWTPLLWAANNGYKNIVLILLEGGANFDYQDHLGRTPLLAATKWGNKSIVQLLIVQGANIELKDKDNWTPLLWAANNGYKDIVQILLKGGAMLNCQDRYGRTPLVAATKMGHKAVVQLLVEQSANIELKY